MACVLEVLIEKRVSQPMAGIGKERVDGPPRRGGPELIHPLLRRQVCFHDGDGGAKIPEAVGGRPNPGAVGRDKQNESLLGADRRQFQSDAR